MVVKDLQKEGYKAEFCGEYPWEKCYNSNHQPTRINAEELSRDFFAFFLVAFTTQNKASIVYLIIAFIFLAL